MAYVRVKSDDSDTAEWIEVEVTESSISFFSYSYDGLCFSRSLWEGVVQVVREVTAKEEQQITEEKGK